MKYFTPLAICMLICVVGCERPNPPDGIWAVTGEAQLISSEHVYWLPQDDEPEPPAWIDTYTIRIEDGPERKDLVWSGTEQNPYKLKLGDRFTLDSTALDDTYSEDHHAYAVVPSDVHQLPD